jgi:hypothetical protein
MIKLKDEIMNKRLIIFKVSEDDKNNNIEKKKKKGKKLFNISIKEILY